MIVFGYLGYRDMGISQFPEIDFPVVSITTYREAADPETMDFDVTDVIEDAVSGVEGIDYIQSQSASKASRVTTVFFRLSRNIDVAMQDVQNAVSAAAQPPAQRHRPAHHLQGQLQQVPRHLADASTATGRIAGDQRLRRHRAQAADRDDPRLRRRHVRRPAAAQHAHLARRREAAGYNLDPLDVMRAMRSEHVEKPAGYIKSNLREINVRVMGEARTPRRSSRSCRSSTATARWSTSATWRSIEDGLADRRSFARFNREPNVGVGVMRATGANVVAGLRRGQAPPAGAAQAAAAGHGDQHLDRLLAVHQGGHRGGQAVAAVYGIVLTAIVTLLLPRLDRHDAQRLHLDPDVADRHVHRP